MGINDKSMVTAQTTMSLPIKETRKDSPDASRPSSTKTPELKIFNPEDKPVAENTAIDTAKQEATKARLHVVDEKGERTPVVKTIGEANSSGENVLVAGLEDVHGIASRLSAGACCFAALASKILPKNSKISKILIQVADITVKFSITGIGTLRGLYTAARNGKPLMLLSHLINGGTSMLPMTEITNARGLPIGMLNALQAAEMIDGGKHAKESYDSIGDHFKHQLQAYKSVAKQFISNPKVIFDKGVIGTGIGLLMMGTTICYAFFKPINTTISNWFAGTRDMLGMLVETEGLQRAHFNDGRVNLISKSGKFLTGSFFNLLSKVSPANAKFFSLLNLAFNSSGDADRMQSLAMNEQNHVGKPVTVGDVLMTGLKSMITFKSQVHEQLRNTEPVVLTKKHQSKEVQKQVQAMNGHSAANRISSVAADSSERRVTSLGRSTPQLKATPAKTLVPVQPREGVPVSATRIESTNAPTKQVETRVANDSPKVNQPSPQGRASFSRPTAPSFAKFANIPAQQNTSTPKSSPEKQVIKK